MGERPSGIENIYPGVQGLSDDGSELNGEIFVLIGLKLYDPKFDGKRYCCNSRIEGYGCSTRSSNNVPIIVNNALTLTVHLRKSLGLVCGRNGNIANGICKTLVLP